MDADTARARFTAERVARLATAGADGTPHVVPVVFAVIAGRIVTAVDHKPKTTTNLRRLRNIQENPEVSLLTDHYDDEDWTALWWARADGHAHLAEHGPDHEAALDALVAKYPQYEDHRPEGPAIIVHITRWTGWSAT